jgi:hypothetical protein
MGTRRAARGWVRLLLMGGIAMSCVSSSAGRKADHGSGPSPRDTRIVHEECPVEDSGVVAEDVNGDGRPDRRTVSENGHVRCRGLDFNFDVDEVAVYANGVLSERQRATTLSGKLDTWQHYQNGKVASAERDSNGDEYVDQWWEYPEQRSADCPLIHSDVNGDGRPDPGATVDVCKDQYVPAARDGEKAAGEGENDPALTDVPTEVDPATPAPDANGTDAESTPAPPAVGSSTEGKP